MQAIKIVLVVIVFSSLIVWVRSGDSFHIAEVLPLCGGHPVGFYDVGAIAMLGITAWGLGRLGRAGRWETEALTDTDENDEDDENDELQASTEEADD